MNCRDCIHYDVCSKKDGTTDYYGKIGACNYVDELCKYFKDKSLIVELPCKIGKFVYADINLFCKDCLREKVRKLDYICCDVINIRYDRNMKALIYLRPLYRRDFNSRYHIFVPSSAIGTTVFLTVQEAQEKLKELKNEQEKA